MDYNDRDSDDTTTEAQRDPTDLEAPLLTDTVLKLLAHPYRRGVLQYFVDASNETLGIGEVTTHLMGRERERTGDQPERDRVEVALHHVHLPALADRGVIEYDARSRELRYRRYTRLEALLECVCSVESV